jgi:hypothetical protein
VPLYICNTKLCLANSAEAVKNNYSAGAVAAEYLMYLYELCLPYYEVFDVGNIREAKGDYEVITLEP